jgi:diguanylate cyclase (GGDEF)-like protein
MKLRDKTTVLIFDEDPVFGIVAIDTLQLAGFNAVAAGEGQTPMAAFEQHAPDLVMIEVDKPGTPGFDLCAQIRAHPEGRDVPIVMVTGNYDTESISRAYRVGATDFVNKPILWAMLPHRLGFLHRAHLNVRALQTSDQKNRALLSALPDTLVVVDSQGLVLQEIVVGESVAGRTLVGRPFEEILPAEVARRARQAMYAPGTGVQSYEFSTGNGIAQRSFEARLCPRPDGNFLIVMRDATERRRAEARIQYLAYYDTLTGLPNRQLFVRELRRAIRIAERSGHKIALLYLDLDKFKRINDNLGHAIGDSLLQDVARRLESSVRPTDFVATANPDAGPADTRIARVGGDEFVVLLSGLTEDSQAGAIATRVRQALTEPFSCGGHRFVVTPSIGIAMFPQDGSDMEDLMVKADMAMYQAKDQGRNGHAFYGESMNVRSLGRMELESDLRRAFESNDFTLCYQPKMNLSSGAITGVEALLRWHHAERGWIPPNSFISLAEETGLIVPLGEWVVHEACKQLKLWSAQGLGYLTIAVNISPQHFARDDFVDSVLRAMRQFGIKPQQLEIEITEGVLMRNVAETTAALNRLRAAGLTLSIDDFGTGYSSLGYLKQFPVDALKIDRSFVKDSHVSSDDAAICAAIIAMARELRLKVIAEGVEVAEQVEFLRKHGCDQIQGYLVSKPISAENLEDLLRHGSTGAEVTQAVPVGEYAGD